MGARKCGWGVSFSRRQTDQLPDNGLPLRLAGEGLGLLNSWSAARRVFTADVLPPQTLPADPYDKGDQLQQPE